MRTILVRKEEYGGTCGVCGSKVLLLVDGETWRLQCDCKIIDVPRYIMVDPYQKKKYRQRFEMEVLPDCH